MKHRGGNNTVYRLQRASSFLQLAGSVLYVRRALWNARTDITRLTTGQQPYPCTVCGQEYAGKAAAIRLKGEIDGKTSTSLAHLLKYRHLCQKHTTISGRDWVATRSSTPLPMSLIYTNFIQCCPSRSTIARSLERNTSQLSK